MKREERKKKFLPRTTRTTRTRASKSDYRFVYAPQVRVRAGSWLIILMLFVSGNISALDFGVVLHQNAAAYNTADSDAAAFEYNAVLAPRVSFLAGENGAVFISAAMNFGYNDGFYYAPELMRTEYSFNKGALGFRIGRINHADPTSFIVNGLFDGARLTHSSSAGRFGFGAWYAGLQYKKSANITMTGEELAAYNSPLDYADFAGTYFAPSRLLASADWEHLSLFGFLRLASAVTGQFDISNADAKLHTQYFTLKAGARFNSVLFELGGTLGTAQTVTEQETEFNPSFAGEAGVYWTPPANIDSRLALKATYASGDKGDFAAFVPVSTKYHAEIYQVKMSSLSVMTLNYTTRWLSALGTDLSAACFLNDEFNYLGTEVFARLVWSPLSDLQFNFGGGVFLSEEKPQWRCNITAILAY